MPYHHGNLKPALIAAASEILDSEGLAGLSLRAAARRAGVSRQAPYNHFRDADDLIAAVAEAGFRELLRELTEDTAETDATRKLQETGIRYVRFAVVNPGRFRVMFGPQLQRREDFPALAQAAGLVFEALSGPVVPLPVRAGKGSVADGSLSIPPADPRTALWSVVHGLAHLLIDRQLTAAWPDAGTAEEYARAVTEAVWFGLADG